ncbi:MAG TPA: 2-amino-4-hydroxy-6-hydroxymethyldihydropteridine diphosphokinase [Allosphingosinicella sp.]|nr:2-amino-4-hydroxy-6-hydroxymethyldihydropteridine diphosphokinase [Allosphingosinicella sp.]
MAATSYAIALGSNRRSRYGSPAETLRAATAALAGVKAVSTIRATPALGPAGRCFANALAIVERDLEPDALLAELKAIERAFGRRAGRRWGPRVLDLDIILWSQGAWGGPGPIIPHPEFRGRRFVLQPLAELVPGWRDPLTGATMRQLLARLTAPRPHATSLIVRDRSTIVLRSRA